MGKGETARHEQFLLFPQCFQTICSADMQTQRLVWKRIEVENLNLTDSFFVAFVEDNATMSSIGYFENYVSYFVQNRGK